MIPYDFKITANGEQLGKFRTLAATLIKAQAKALQWAKNLSEPDAKIGIKLILKFPEKGLDTVDLLV